MSLAMGIESAVVGLGAARGWAVDLSRVATGGLVAAVWQGVLLSLAVALGMKLLPKTPAAIRFAIWFGVFLVVAGLPVMALLPRSGAAAAGGRAPWLTLDERWCVAIAAVWAAASLVRAVTLGLAVLRVRALWKRATPLEGAGFVRPTDRDEAAMTGARAPLGSGVRSAKLCVSDEVDRPTVIGFFAPKILIPGWLVEKLTAAELEQIVLHEAGHLGRADDWLNLLQKIALVVFPLNPALAWVERRLCFERELACDERVLKTTGAPKAYAACLATLAEYRMNRSGLALALGALGRESELGRRVGRILKRGELMRPAQARLVLGGAMLGLFGATVSLGRCPQLVGFAPYAELSASATAPASAGNGVVGRYGYQAVVFQPATRKNSGLPLKMKVPHEVQAAIPESYGAANAEAHEVLAEGVGPRGVLAGYRVHSTLLKSDAPSKTDVLQRVAGQAPQTERVVQWVVVTSWQGEDGARVVMTSIATASTREAIGRAPVVSDAWSAPNPDEVYPYAAVPVRDGWLVIQL